MSTVSRSQGEVCLDSLHVWIIQETYVPDSEPVHVYGWDPWNLRYKTIDIQGP